MPLALFTLLLLFTERARAPLPPPESAPDSTVEAARAALQRGLPWRASMLLAPVLADSTRRTPEATMLAATAASQWGGWAQVEALLGREPWTDTAFDGTGRALLARAALERRADSSAARQAQASLRSAPDDGARGERLVLLARALDRMDSLEAAAAAYTEAARLLPRIGGWLAFRAAVVTADSARRSRALAALILPAARERIRAAEAEALRRSGPPLSAAAAYSALGAWGDAYALRLEATGGADSARARLRAELLTVLETRTGTAQARAAAEALATGFAPLDAATDLRVARALVLSGGSRPRAIEGFRRGFAAGLGTSRDHFDQARLLFASDRYAEAAREYRRVTAPRALAASAGYERGRAMVRDGQLAAGRTALRAVVAKFPAETDAAASALFLLGDLASDERRDTAAREAFRTLAARYPRARIAPAAAFRAAFTAFVLGHERTAALELDKLLARYPASGETSAARYWAGRAWAAAGDSAAARARWEATVDGERDGYYGSAASRRLGIAPWTPPPAADTFVVVRGVDSALARVALLERLGMEREARWEADAAIRLADSTAEGLLATADAFRSSDMASRGIRLAWRALARGAAADARTYRLLYPLRHREAILAEAGARGVDPSFAAALIRQESMFTPSATSAAGARGLMQVMPAVGRTVARSLRFPLWDAVLLYEPDVNVQLGMFHLDELVERYPGWPVKVLAAYNAGASRVERWAEKAGVADPEAFIERIPYPETRDYVRIIQRNQELYRALYP